MKMQFTFEPAAEVLAPEALQNIVEMFGDEDADAILELIDTFLVESTKQYEEMRAALAAGDWVKLHRMAHSLKSSSATFGAMRLSQVAAFIEKVAKAQCQEADCAALLDLLATEHEAACAQLRQARARFAGEDAGS
ncbi:Hpt domain-containing protein [Caldilinea sp.]|uniref:Hpt domain-containing protein n=1 Tax=Caldilinea sp. TaxID=2293560 RepID=UPI00260B29AF|nr:Hpt domain-containing protein [uncultured Caldilinea sp.]